MRVRMIRWFGNLDTDSDGNIMRSEWRSKEEMFNRLDANSDRPLSRDELRGAREQHRPDSPCLDRSEKNTLWVADGSRQRLATR